jgi:hypothetical protein
MKKYKLLKDYETPSFIIRAGVIKTLNEWKEIFRDLSSDDFDIKNDWFELIKCDHNKRHSMCNDQTAQIDCRIETCFHYEHSGNCINISPAITLNEDGTFNCWSYDHKDS